MSIPSRDEMVSSILFSILIPNLLFVLSLIVLVYWWVGGLCVSLCVRIYVCLYVRVERVRERRGNEREKVRRTEQRLRVLKGNFNTEVFYSY